MADLTAVAPPTVSVYPLNLGAVFTIGPVATATTFEYRIDGGAEVSVAATATGAVVKLLGTLTNAAHTVEVRALDSVTTTATVWSAPVSFTPTTLAKHWDDFERADSTTVVGAPVFGNAYTTGGSRVWGLTAGAAYAPGGSGIGMLLTDVGTADIRLTATRVNAANTYMGLVFRYIDASNFWYLQQDNGPATNNVLRLLRYVAGTSYMQAQYYWTAWNVGETVVVSAYGDKVTVRLRDKVVMECADLHTRTGATKVGLHTDVVTAQFGMLAATQTTGTEDDALGAIEAEVTESAVPSTLAHVFKGRDTYTADTGSVA